MLYPTYKPVINWRNDANLSNLYSIHLRITLRGVRKYIAIPLPQKVALDQWADKPNAWVKNTHPFAFEINNAIKAKVTVLNDLVKRYYNSKKNLDFPTILRELGKNYNTQSFNKYFDAYNKAPREKVVDDTLNKYRTCLKWLDKFNPNITFNDLSDTLFQDFKKYLETEAKLEPSTLLSYFSAIKKVVYWARKDNHITKDHQETIFEDVHIKVGKKPSEHLEVHHIIALRDFDFSTKRQPYENSRDRDLFLLLVYTGLYYSDLKDLQKSDGLRGAFIKPGRLQ